jgi:hypothetical protein
MNKFHSSAAHSSALKNIYQLYLFLSPQRRVQIYLVFTLQILCAIFEVVSIGAIIPFLSALANTDALTHNQYISYLINLVGISNSTELILILAIAFSVGIFLTNILRFTTLFAQQYLSAAISVDI